MIHKLKFNKRIKIRRNNRKIGKILYWMSREHRLNNNFAFASVLELSEITINKISVVYCVSPEFLNANPRNYYFLFEGLREIETILNNNQIEFNILEGNPGEKLSEYINSNSISTVFTDFNPLKIKKSWDDIILENTDADYFEVDSRNIVPVWLASPKQEWGAYTIRKKLHAKLDEFIQDSFNYYNRNEKIILNCFQVKKLIEKLKNHIEFEKLTWISGGEKNSFDRLQYFIDKKLDNYNKKRNNPEYHFQSDLSPYLHFGNIFSGEIIKTVKQSGKDKESIEGFIEECFVRRELAENFCFYNSDYDNIACAPDWARQTLEKHRDDKREYVYSYKEFKQAMTHDKVWNICQRQLIEYGKIHSYLRMYWAKKILEWSDTPENAVNTAIMLNDIYAVDGRDPNGYTGIMWSICGIHDRAWKERDIFGKIRYMNLNGLKRKFDTEKIKEDFSKYE